jgi:hypothetical protein
MLTNGGRQFPSRQSRQPRHRFADFSYLLRTESPATLYPLASVYRIHQETILASSQAYCVSFILPKSICVVYRPFAKALFYFGRRPLPGLAFGGHASGLVMEVLAECAIPFRNKCSSYRFRHLPYRDVQVPRMQEV